MNDDQASYDEIFLEVQADFKIDLKAWFEALDQAILALDINTPESIEQVLEWSHKITGSSGSFGFPEVSEAAAPIEEFSLNGLKPEAKISEADIAQVKADLETLRSLLPAW